jgi:hypothetical protein
MQASIYSFGFDKNLQQLVVNFYVGLNKKIKGLFYKVLKIKSFNNLRRLKFLFFNSFKGLENKNFNNWLSFVYLPLKDSQFTKFSLFEPNCMSLNKLKRFEIYLVKDLDWGKFLLLDGFEKVKQIKFKKNWKQKYFYKVLNFTWNLKLFVNNNLIIQILNNFSNALNGFFENYLKIKFLILFLNKIFFKFLNNMLIYFFLCLGFTW